MDSENQVGSNPLPNNPMLGCMLNIRPGDGHEERKDDRDEPIEMMASLQETLVGRLT